MSDIVTLFG